MKESELKKDAFRVYDKKFKEFDAYVKLPWFMSFSNDFNISYMILYDRSWYFLEIDMTKPA